MLKNLDNIRSPRAMAHKLSAGILGDMPGKFRVVTKERRDEEEQMQRQRVEQQIKINVSLVQVQVDGISPGELLSITPTTACSVKKRQPRPAKYYFIDLNDKTKTWTGQGRVPKPVAQALVVGKSLDDSLI